MFKIILQFKAKFFFLKIISNFLEIGKKNFLFDKIESSFVDEIFM